MSAQLSDLGVLNEALERIAKLEAEIADHYREQARLLELEVALKKHHTGIGCINYCRTCGGHFSWEDPARVVSFQADGEVAK